MTCPIRAGTTSQPARYTTPNPVGTLWRKYLYSFG